MKQERINTKDKPKMLSSFTFPISNSEGCVNAFPKCSVSRVEMWLCSLGVIEEEYEIWDNPAESYAEVHEDLVKEEDVLVRNAVRKYSLKDRERGR
jgi:hypothetical protein